MYGKLQNHLKQELQTIKNNGLFNIATVDGFRQSQLQAISDCTNLV